jgi:predicted nucleic-acid-binding protein
MLDEYQNENNKEKERREATIEATIERILQNPEAIVSTNDLNRRRFALVAITNSIWNDVIIIRFSSKSCSEYN